MLTTLYTLLVVAILFGLTIFSHELGHFLVARWCGLVVDVFSLGFGPALWKRKHNGIVYKIGCIPFGGYVALPQLDPSGMSLVQGNAEPAKDAGAETRAPDGQPDVPPGPGADRVLPAVSPWKRMAVSVAGAAGNMIFAVVLALAVYVIGKPATPAEVSATVGYVDVKSKAYQQGLRLGDEILSVNNEPVRSWYDFLVVCSRYKETALVVRRDAGQITLHVPTEKGLFGMQMVDGVDGRSLCMVLAATPGMSADRAGLRRGDIIVELDGQGIFSRAQLISLVGERQGKSVPIKVKREGKIVAALVTPDYDETAKQVRIGVTFNITDVEFDEIVHPGVWEQIKSHSTAIFRTLAALATPSQAKATSQGLGGPVAILINYWYIVKVSFMVAVFFTCFLNVNLAILNLLPIPVLDGGHILFSLWQALTGRYPNARVVNSLTNFFAILLIAVFVLLTGRDFMRFTSLGRLVDRWTAPAKHAPATPTTAPMPTHTNAPAP